MAQYLKPDSELGYVEDNAKIGYLKFNNLRHSIFGCMLGDFNEVGNYVVSPEIVSELIAMEKYVVESFDNIELCKSFLKLDKQISFMVTFEGNRATLSLVEKVNYESNFAINSGTYSNINEYVLDVVETSGEINRNIVYDRWNISQFGGNVVDIFNCDDSVLEKLFGIVNRFKYLLEANKILLDKEEELEEIEAGYTNNVFEILKRYPKFEAEVISTLKKTLTEKKNAVSVKKPFFAKTLNEVLENAIEQNVGILNEQEKQEFEKEKRNAVLNLNIKREDALDIVHVVNGDENKNEVGPKVVSLNVSETNSLKTVTEHGEALVSSNKRVYERILNNAESEKPTIGAERSKLELILLGKGLAEVVGVKQINKETEKTTDVVAGAGVKQEIKQKPKTATQTTNPQQTKKPVAGKSGGNSTKKTDGKKPQATKSTKPTPPAATDDNKQSIIHNWAFRRLISNVGSPSVSATGEEALRRKKKTHNVEVARVQGNAKIDSATKTEPIKQTTEAVTVVSENNIDLEFHNGI